MYETTGSTTHNTKPRTQVSQTRTCDALRSLLSFGNSIYLVSCHNRIEHTNDAYNAAHLLLCVVFHRLRDVLPQLLPSHGHHVGALAHVLLSGEQKGCVSVQ
jgi:hypothetical protein